MNDDIVKINMRDIARSGHVTRWHSVRTARSQTIAEHHYMVTMIGREMAKRIMKDKLSDSQMIVLLEYLLDHDTPELLYTKAYLFTFLLTQYFLVFPVNIMPFV